MSKIVYGRVTLTCDADFDSCKCYAKDSQFYVNDSDLMHTLRYTSKPVSYVVFNEIPDNLSVLNIPFSEYFKGDAEYDTLSDYITEVVLKSFYCTTESHYMSTCYSEWTCGDPGDQEFTRLGELASLEGKFIIMRIE